MKLKTEGLQERLLEIVGDEEFSNALCETAIEIASEFKGEPKEFAKAVYTATREAGFKVADGGMYNHMARVINEAVVVDEGGGDQSSSSNATKPEDGKPKDPGEAELPPPKKIRVALKPSIAAYGGQFYDPDEKIWIKGTEKEPQEVLATLFVKQKVASGELIEVG